MGIFSAEPIVFIGPGSEWFWSMAQFVVVAVTLLGIYYQFRLQRAANAFEQLQRIGEEWGSEPMLRARLALGRAFVAEEVVPEGALALIGNYWEDVASLVREGHVGERVVGETYGGNAALYWRSIESETQTLRARALDAEVFENFEWLARRFDPAGAKAAASRWDRATIARIFEAGIPGLEDRIRMAEESRMVPTRRAPRRSAHS